MNPMQSLLVIVLTSLSVQLADVRVAQAADRPSIHQPAVAAKPLSTFRKGRQVSRSYWFAETNTQIPYSLYIPENYDGRTPYSLIVALHGLHSKPWQILGYPGLTKYADKHRCILIAPMGYNDHGWYGSLGTGGGRGRDPRNLGELSEQDVLNVVAIARSTFFIDPQNIILYGHSMGGGGAIHLAMKYPEKWAAIAVIAPAAYGNTDRIRQAKQTPMFIVQGGKDRLVKASMTRRWVRSMKEHKIPHRYIEDENGGHVFVAWKYWDEMFAFLGEHVFETMSE